MINKHGVDVSKIKAGDTYLVECHATADGLTHHGPGHRDNITSHTPAPRPIEAGGRVRWGVADDVKVVHVSGGLAWVTGGHNWQRIVDLGELTRL
jgi:hypothetical protein